MERTDRSYSSGEWKVRAGSEEGFVQRWTTFIEWSLENAPGAGSFVLVRSTEDPTKFLSLRSWESQQAQQAWREMPRMQELLGQCRQLCEEFDSHPYTLAAGRPKGPLGGVTDTVGGVTEPVSGVTDTVRGTMDRLLGGGKEEQREKRAPARYRDVRRGGGRGRSTHRPLSSPLSTLFSERRGRQNRRTLPFPSSTSFVLTEF